MVQVTNVTFQDVLDVAEGGACPLRMTLSETKPPMAALKRQYYFLRSIYCRAKFAEEYGRKPFPADLAGVPPSIIDYWNKCNGVLRQIIAKTGLRFYNINIPVKPSDFDEQIFVDATGCTSDKEFVVIKLVWGSQLRKHYKIQLVKQLDYLHETVSTAYLGGRSPDDISLAALMVGKDDGDEDGVDISKLVRFVPSADVLDKKGKVKEKGWNGLRSEFDGALVEARRIVAQSAGNPLSLVPTVPGPMTCGSCPYHNIEIAENGQKVCTGYFHPAI